MATTGFARAYEGSPPWEIGRPQPAVAGLVERGELTGSVLDVGCGTGENALHLAAHGRAVLGVDGAPAAVDDARGKATQRHLTALFAVGDALRLVDLGERFDTVLDSAFFHVLPDDETRRAYALQLAHVLRPGGSAYLLEVSEKAAGAPAPFVRADQIRAAFDTPHWTVESVAESTYSATFGDLPAWLVTVRRS